MAKSLSRPVQLRLEFSWDYLEWMGAVSEGFDLYEAATLKLLTGPPGLIETSPVLEECFPYQDV